MAPGRTWCFLPLSSWSWRVMAPWCPPGELGLYGNPLPQTRSQKSYWPMEMEPSRTGWPRASRPQILIMAAMSWISGLLSQEGSTMEPLFCTQCSLADSGPRFPHLSDGLQFALPIFSRPLGGSTEKGGGRVVRSGSATLSCPGSSSASGTRRRRPRLGVPSNSQVTQGSSSCTGPRSPHL